MKTLTIDLRWKAELEERWAEYYHRASRECRGPFMEWCDSFLKKEDEFAWYISMPLSRDVLQSSFFHHIVCLEGIKGSEELLKSFDAVTIRTNSPALSELLSRMTEERGLKMVKIDLTEGSAEVWPLFRALAEKMLHWLCAKIYVRPNHPSKTEKLVLVENFIHPGHTKDRYYPGLLDELSSRGTGENVYFVPNVVSTPLGKMKSVFQGISERKEKFLLKDHFLGLGDILSSFFQALKQRKLSPREEVSFKGWSLSSLLREELKRPTSFGSSLGAFLIHRFTHRLKEKGYQVAKAIDWHENQVIDKAWNHGFRNQFPEARLIGYQGMLVSEMYLHKYPLDAEVIGGYEPDELLGVGARVSAELKEFSGLLKTGVGPAFRFQQVFTTIERRPVRNCFLIALPISVYEAEKILRIIHDADSHGEFFWKLRFHPSQDPIDFDSYTKPLRSYEISRDPLNQDFSSCEMMISTSSSICYEALSHGLKVILVRTNCGIDFNPFPSDFLTEAWASVDSGKKLVEAIDRLQGSFLENMRQDVLDAYFRETDEESLKHFS